MRGWLLLVLVGCTGADVGDGPAPMGNDPLFEIGETAEPVLPPEGCDHSVSLYGMTESAEPTSVGPLEIDTKGVAICLSLDARDNIWVAHFAAGTRYEDGTSSSFAMRLFDANDGLLRAGWDVTFGGDPPRTFANLEYGVKKGQLLEAVLHVRAKSGSASSALALRLFEPYE